MPLPDSISDRIELFARNEEQYRDSGYKEAQLRQEFLDPFFAALGWDMDNHAGHAESYKDVIHEDAIKIGRETKAPDYSFRIGGTRKFFVEAKKPSVLIKDDPEPAYQLRRYSWSAKLPLGILTDFQEFAIYDGRVRPAFGDKAHVARLFYCTYDQFPEKWDEIAGIFSKESVLRGSFDKYAAATRGKRGTATVDVAFLEEIERWRDVFARHLALRNESLSQRDLNFVVQRLIDRLIFLRIAEDRGLEPFGQLQALTAGNNLYPRLREIFERADYRYNSGLFHFEKDSDCSESPDRLSLRLELDDAPLKDVLKNLYYPASPYVFSVIPADILGSVYERFLGKVIHLTETHKARIEEKPEVRKAGGVYYTPTYIVDYIVRQTVGTLVADKTPKQIEKLRVLDPACGSGSFLIGAYQFLLDWYLGYYTKNDPEKWAKQKPARLYETNPNQGRDAFGQIRATPDSIRNPQSEFRNRRNWQLTTAERKRILLAHIHGVDIDSQAVEVTKLSLLLKVLEGEARETQGRTREMSAVLPDLGKNIRWGNSLVGHDFYAQPDLPALDDEARLQLNTFDWAEGFPEVIRAGGFDAVIGNPPYVRIQTLQETQPEAAAYLSSHYRSAKAGNYDLYVCFVERGLTLLNPKGRLGFILPHKFFNAEYGAGLRGLLATGRHVEAIVHFGHQQVFAGATTYTAILSLTRAANPELTFAAVDNLEHWHTGTEVARNSVVATALSAEPWSFAAGPAGALRTKLERSGKPLGRVASIFVGLQTSADDVFVLPAIGKLEKPALKPFLTTGDLSAYSPARPTAWMIFPYESTGERAALIPAAALRKQAPNVWRHLETNGERLRARERGKWDHERWYAFGRSQNLTQMAAPKLIVQVTALRPTVILDETGLHMTGGGSGPFYGIRPTAEGLSLRYLLGLLNSRLFGWFVRGQSTVLRGGYIKFSKQYIETAPIVLPPSKDRHDRLVALVDTMLALHAKLAAAQSPYIEDNLRRQIAATDQAIDALVYALYGLAPEEIALVESATAPQAANEPSDEVIPAAPPPTPPAAPADTFPRIVYGKSESDAAHFYGVQEDAPTEKE